MKRAVAYLRISRESENIENQRRAIQEWAKKNGFEIVAWFKDEDVSGAVPPREREGYRAMIKFCEDNKIRTIIFYDLSRLARNMIEGLKELNRLAEEGYDIYTLDRVFELINNIQYQSLKKIVLALLLGFAEFYREDIIRRTKEGLKRAKAEGKKLGRPLKLNPTQIKILQDLYKKGYSYSKIAEALGISKATVHRYIKRLGLKRR